MQLVDVGMFALIFFVTYLVCAIFVKILHLITKNHTKNYRVGVIIFALLVAATVTYNNLGRWNTNYADPSALFQTKNQENN